MTREDFAERLRTQTLDARMNQKYHARLESRFAGLDRLERIFAAIAGSAAVASFALWSTNSGKTTWAVLTGVAALGNAIAAAASPGEAARKHGSLRQRFIDLRFDFEELQMELDNSTGEPDNRLNERLISLIRRRKTIEADQPPPSRSLLRWAQREVNEEVGHRKADGG